MAKYLTKFSFYSRTTGNELVCGYGSDQPTESTAADAQEVLSKFAELFASDRIESLVLHSLANPSAAVFALNATFIKECFVCVSLVKVED